MIAMAKEKSADNRTTIISNRALWEQFLDAAKAVNALGRAGVQHGNAVQAALLMWTRASAAERKRWLKEVVAFKIDHPEPGEDEPHDDHVDSDARALAQQGDERRRDHARRDRKVR